MAVDFPMTIGYVEMDDTDALVGSVAFLTLTTDMLLGLLAEAANGGDPESIVLRSVAAARVLETDGDSD